MIDLQYEQIYVLIIYTYEWYTFCENRFIQGNIILYIVLYKENNISVAPFFILFNIYNITYNIYNIMFNIYDLMYCNQKVTIFHLQYMYCMNNNHTILLSDSQIIQSLSSS